MKNKQEITDNELVTLFNNAESIQEKLNLFGKIKNEELKISLLNNIPTEEKYKFLGKLRNPQNIAEQLNNLDNEKSKKKSLNFIAKQLKGNSKGLLSILQNIDFEVVLPENMLTFNLNSLKDISMDAMIKLQEHVENSFDIKFNINEKDSEGITYSFAELSAITAKLEELTAGVTTDMEEVNRFYTIYSRMINNITYNNSTITNVEDELEKYITERGYTRQNLDEKMADFRRDAAGLYGGLIDGSAICVGYATILQEALKKVDIKSIIVTGTKIKDIEQGKLFKSGHAWNQVQIDGKWYNADATWDASTVQRTGDISCMLRGDKTFKPHIEFTRDTAIAHECKEDHPFERARFMRIYNQNRWWNGIGGGR